MPADPPGLRALLDGARTLRLEGRGDEAFAVVQDALARFPAAPVAHLAMAFHVALRGEEEDALTHVHHALDLAPGDPDTLMRAAALLAKLGDVEEAVELVEQLEGLEPGAFAEPELAATSRALAALFRDDDSARARRVLRDAIAAGHATPGVVRLLCLLLRDAGRAEEALKVVQDGLRRHPGDPLLEEELDLIASALAGGPQSATPAARGGVSDGTGGARRRSAWPRRHVLPDGDVLVIHGRGRAAEWRVSIEGSDRQAQGHGLAATVAWLLELDEDEPWPEWLVWLAHDLDGLPAFDVRRRRLDETGGGDETH